MADGMAWAFLLALIACAFVVWVTVPPTEGNTGVLMLIASVRTWFFINVVALCALVVVNFTLSLPHWWPDAFAVGTNLLAGGLVSFLFYFLVVHVPERRKKSIIKANLLNTYRNIKEAILRQVIWASVKGGRHDLTADTDTIEMLMSPKGFKDAFQGARESTEGFYAFQNQMDDDTPEFREIVLNLEMLSKQIDFLLHNYSIEDQETFDVFKRLELLLMQLRAYGPGYDEAKPLCRFIYELYAGWSFIVGDIDHDWLEKRISDL